MVHDVQDINPKVVTKVLKHQRWRGQTDQLTIIIVLEGFFMTVAYSNLKCKCLTLKEIQLSTVHIIKQFLTRMHYVLQQHPATDDPNELQTFATQYFHNF